MDNGPRPSEAEAQESVGLRRPTPGPWPRPGPAVLLRVDAVRDDPSPPRKSCTRTSYQLWEKLTVLVGVNRFLTGRFFQQAAGSRRDIDYGYVQATLEF